MCRASDMIHDTSHSNLGDNDIRATNFSCKGAKVSPVLRFCPGSHHMVNTNEELKAKKVGNGSQCKCRTVKPKSGAKRVWKRIYGLILRSHERCNQKKIHQLTSQVAVDESSRGVLYLIVSSKLWHPGRAHTISQFAQ